MLIIITYESLNSISLQSSSDDSISCIINICTIQHNISFIKCNTIPALNLLLTIQKKRAQILLTHSCLYIRESLFWKYTLILIRLLVHLRVNYVCRQRYRNRRISIITSSHQKQCYYSDSSGETFLMEKIKTCNSKKTHKII